MLQALDTLEEAYCAGARIEVSRLYRDLSGGGVGVELIVYETFHVSSETRISSIPSNDRQIALD